MKRSVFTILLSLGGAFAVWYGFFSPKEAMVKSNPTVVATVVSPNRTLENFSLVDANNKPFTKASLEGHWTLLFFGYSKCPDICPRTLMTLNDLWNYFPSEEKNLEFVFVSLDSKHDRPEDLKAFLNRFNPRFNGLTGQEEAVKQLSKNCSIYSWEGKQPETGARIIDHSATLVLVNPKGNIQAFFSPPHKKELIAKDLHTLIKGS